MIALGEERTFDQDPAFALRMMVDIANRALSPAVNDPTTGVQVLDHIGAVFALIGETDFERRTKPSALTCRRGCHGDSELGGLRGDPGSRRSVSSVRRRCRSRDASGPCSRSSSRRYDPSTERRSKKSSDVSMPPSPRAGAMQLTFIARSWPTARGSATPRAARRARGFLELCRGPPLQQPERDGGGLASRGHRFRQANTNAQLRDPPGGE